MIKKNKSHNKVIKIFVISFLSILLLISGIAFTMAQISVTLPPAFQSDIDFILPPRQSDDQLLFLCAYDENAQFHDLNIFEVNGSQLSATVYVEVSYSTNGGNCDGSQGFELTVGPILNQNQFVNLIEAEVINKFRAEGQSNHRPKRARTPISQGLTSTAAGGVVIPGETEIPGVGGN